MPIQATCQNITCTKPDILEYKHKTLLIWTTNFLWNKCFGQKCLATPPKRTPIDSCTSNCVLTNINWLCCTIISHTLQLTLHTKYNGVIMQGWQVLGTFRCSNQNFWTNQYKSSFNMYKYFGHRWLKLNCQNISPFSWSTVESTPQHTGTMLIIAYSKLFSFAPTFALRKWRVMKWHKTCLHEYVRRSERANVELFGTYCRLAKDLHLVWLFEQLIIELT